MIFCYNYLIDNYKEITLKTFNKSVEQKMILKMSKSIK